MLFFWEKWWMFCRGRYIKDLQALEKNFSLSIIVFCIPFPSWIRIHRPIEIHILPVYGSGSRFATLIPKGIFSSSRYCGSGLFIPDPNFSHPWSRIRIKEFKYFNPKNVSKLRNMIRVVSSRIRILIFYPSWIPDPGVKKAPDPGSGSATLFSRLQCRYPTAICVCRCTSCAMRRKLPKRRPSPSTRPKGPARISTTSHSTTRTSTFRRSVPPCSFF